MLLDTLYWVLALDLYKQLIQQHTVFPSYIYGSLVNSFEVGDEIVQLMFHVHLR
jgi:hypothetical protein